MGSQPRSLALARLGRLRAAASRGGGEGGRRWHRAGKLERKRDSVLDFVAAARALVAAGHAHPAKLAAKGTSAGGLLVAAAANEAPALFRAIVLEVPFLDVLGTMLDPGLPLTAHEYDEWGDPRADGAAFAIIRAYSPYANLRPGAAYPAAYVTASLQDTRVSPWEAAKWVARLRDIAPADPGGCRPLLLRTSMDTGHFGEGGRYMRLREAARQYAFLLKYVGGGAGSERQLGTAGSGKNAGPS